VLPKYLVMRMSGLTPPRRRGSASVDRQRPGGVTDEVTAEMMAASKSESQIGEAPSQSPVAGVVVVKMNKDNCY
jgi:hypothetical protein